MACAGELLTSRILTNKSKEILSPHSPHSDDYGDDDDDDDADADAEEKEEGEEEEEEEEEDKDDDDNDNDDNDEDLRHCFNYHSLSIKHNNDDEFFDRAGQLTEKFGNKKLNAN